jgi:hypothetical protein
MEEIHEEVAVNNDAINVLNDEIAKAADAVAEEILVEMVEELKAENEDKVAVLADKTQQVVEELQNVDVAAAPLVMSRLRSATLKNNLLDQPRVRSGTMRNAPAILEEMPMPIPIGANATMRNASAVPTRIATMLNEMKPPSERAATILQNAPSRLRSATIRNAPDAPRVVTIMDEIDNRIPTPASRLRTLAAKPSHLRSGLVNSSIRTAVGEVGPGPFTSTLRTAAVGPGPFTSSIRTAAVGEVGPGPFTSTLRTAVVGPGPFTSTNRTAVVGPGPFTSTNRLGAPSIKVERPSVYIKKEDDTKDLTLWQKFRKLMEPPTPEM